MKKTTTFAALGLLAGIMRIFELRFSYNQKTGLPGQQFDGKIDPATGEAALRGTVSGFALFFAVAVAVVAVGLVVFLCTKTQKYINDTPDGPYISLPQRVLYGLGGLSLLTSAVMDGVALSTTKFVLPQAVLCIIGVVAAICMVALAVRAKTSRMTAGALFAVVVFWVCLWFLMMFSTNAANPLVHTWWPEFLTVLVSMLAISQTAAAHFGREKRGPYRFLVLFGIFISIATLVGAVGSELLGAAAESAVGNLSLTGTVSLAGFFRVGAVMAILLAVPTTRVDAQPLQDPDDISGEDEEESPADGQI